LAAEINWSAIEMNLYVFFYNKVLGSSRDSKRVEIRQDAVRKKAFFVGSQANSEIHLEGLQIPAKAAQIQFVNNEWVFNLIEGKCKFAANGEKIAAGSVVRIIDRQIFELFPFVIEFRYEEGEIAPEETRQIVVNNQRTMEVVRVIHRELIPEIQIELEEIQSASQLSEFLNTIEKRIEQIARTSGLLEQQLVDHLAGLCIRSELLNQVMSIESQHEGDNTQDIWHTDNRWRKLVSVVSQLEKELAHVRDLIASGLNIKISETARSKEEFSRRIAQIEKEFWNRWVAFPGRLHADFKIYLALRHLKKEIKDIVYGYGPLEDLISTPSITEIMVVNRDRIYIERDGVIENSGRQFVSDLVTESIIQRMVNNVGAHIDRSKPMADARLKDGSRVNAVIQPTAVSGPCLTIRKFTTHRYGMKDLIETGSISAEAAEFLKAAVEDRRNIIVSGSTGTGKTTFLNILSACIPKRERVVTIEDTAELLLKMEHVVRLETKAENIEGKGLITIRDLVKNALRMRPDRIIVGECRSGEALDMLQAMNTGHDGSMTTIHANSASGVISRLEVLVQLAADSDLPVHTIHHQIASAVDLIVQLKRENNGRRHVVQIAECAGIDPVTQNIRLKDIFLASPYCELRPTGRLPSFLDRLLEHNLIGLDRFLPA
jgi:pilus assembly protein CpaF